MTQHKQADLTYRRDGMFTRFYAETSAGKIAWNQMAEQMEGVAAVFNWQEKSTIRQLRQAGYVVRKAAPCDITTDQILAELDA